MAKGGAISTKIPLVVLVDRGTASAAEIVTGALQDRGRAKVVGTHTYGKGVFQEIQPLSNGGALDITVGEYFTPERAQPRRRRGPAGCAGSRRTSTRSTSPQRPTSTARWSSPSRRSPPSSGERLAPGGAGAAPGGGAASGGASSWSPSRSSSPGRGSWSAATARRDVGDLVVAASAPAGRGAPGGGAGAADRAAARAARTWPAT